MTNKIKSGTLSRVTATDLPSDLDLLALEARSRFVIDGDGRMLNENDPDLSPAPLMFMAGCDMGNLVHLNREVSDAAQDAILALVSDEPALTSASMPRHLDRYLALLSGGARMRVGAGLSFHLPHDVYLDGDVDLVLSGTPEGTRLEAELAERGMPPALVEMGFRSGEDLWAPWCLALRDGEVASLAFAARLGVEGAELGLATSPPFRGRGLAAAATAGWARHPDLACRTLFYSTASTNLASQRVVAKLELRLIGATLDISREP